MKSLLSRNNLAKINLCGFLSIASLNPTDSLMAAEVPVCKWNYPKSTTNSQIIEQKNALNANWGHIFCGNVNRRKSKATGYHHRESGIDSPTARIGEIRQINETTGVYEASPIYVWNVGQWAIKARGSTFFPDHCSVSQVMTSIKHAAGNITCRYSNGKWGGQSGPIHGGKRYCYGKSGYALAINGYFHRKSGDIATAWPIIENTQPNACIH